MRIKLTRRRILLFALTGIFLLAAVAGWGVWFYSFDQRFARSRPALDAFAAQVLTAGPDAPLTLPASIGAFEVGDGFRLPHGFAFSADYGHPLDWNGLAYSTEPLPEELPDTRPPFQVMVFHHIDGNWYTVLRN